MKLSQFGTKIFALATFTLLAANSFAVAGESLNPSQEVLAFKARLKQIYEDKNRPVPKDSTAELSIKTNKKIKFPVSNAAVKMGGVSDGGGNAVGSTLFDFYENAGSLEITLEQLLNLEPKAKQMVELLNQQVPAVDHVESGGLGEILKNSLNGKKIYLESKPISSEACKNQSLVSTDQQIVAACQSDKELRLDVNWLQSASANNRAGLINHELILAWARKKSASDAKDVLEQKVRELNRECFVAHSSGDQMPDAVSRIFSVRAFSAKRFKIAAGLPARVKAATVAFCNNPTTDINSAFQDVWNDDFLTSEARIVPGNLQSMKEVSMAALLGEDKSIVAKSQADLCKYYNIDNTPIHEPRMDIIPDGCVNHLQKSIDMTASYYTAEFKDITADNLMYFRASAKDVIESSALLCKGLRGNQLQKQWFMTKEKGYAMMDETYGEAINFVRYVLKKKKINYSFFDPK
ncbi:hypothetical protein [Bdellovibrio svalbardensis]|uniref:Uncharacterized protein n=1 Tax=Bdellovibrio svalbardensis TaxID=2972972 RepID=A0ABT6DEJ4_9BACT|nr:hypothetical protein [Bdellovibrio svalbardensis]MDG0814907.1 hypothetical protein [Bdellovibrio svalbardensis]